MESLELINQEATAEDIERCAEELIEEYPFSVDKYLEDENNYGLLFHMAGYDGEKQQELSNYFRNYFGVNVF
ncbi:hypothetical protein [Staphylococcus pettenkoferi]|uniref:hypothetical protein n=1 Tax=Staphylococcus pettenkoferi TaxID=170573 RepID=UPI002553C870|nr:hypothetical protein [Staphylococcus pettenkoferi]MDK7284462.1 hypothetical protein [Staphylococcus pettenkoferi]